jgi:hypothetical protein
VRNNERYLAFYPAVSQAFLEVSDLRCQFFFPPLVHVSYCTGSWVLEYNYTAAVLDLDRPFRHVRRVMHAVASRHARPARLGVIHHLGVY